MERGQGRTQPHTDMGIITDTLIDQNEGEITDELSIFDWQRCECELASCDSCVAERLAIVEETDHRSPSAYINNKLRSLNPRVDVKTAAAAATIRQMVACGLSDPLEQTVTTVTASSGKCFVEPAPPPFSDLVFIYWFHQYIADSKIDGRTEFSHASAIVVLQFACMFGRKPSTLNRRGPSEQVICQVEDSMRTGNARYESIYSMESHELGPEETLKACQDLGLKIVYKDRAFNYLVRTIGQYIMNLGPDQILLIYRYKPYKVLSVVCTADTNSVCLFDSQLHRSYSNIQQGAILFHSLKRMELIVMMLKKFEEFIFQFQGDCDLVVLE